MRLILAPFLGLVVALGLFLFSHSLISDSHLDTLAPEDIVMLEFIRPTPDEKVFMKERQLPDKAPPPKRPPRLARINSTPAARVAQLPVNIDIPNIEVPVATGFGPYLGTYSEGAVGAPVFDGDLIPLVQVSPRYPRIAEHKGIEGWVDVEFTIRADGTVSDPVVVAAEPPMVFERSAMNAIVRWKFKPRVVDGTPVESRGRQLISFDLIERS
ncbi:MAG: energy transducer TonB [Gammaproteobacteria bacterium]|nr:energy transducer TonB [Gammaproteobacteria bacterium]